MQKPNKFLLLFFMLLSAFSQAQTDSTNSDIAIMPEYPGGDDAMNLYLSKNIKYPQLALENEIQGRVVIEIVVGSEGQIKEAKITKNIGFGCGEEALRVVKSMPRWKPGSLNGNPVNVTYKIPVKFTLVNDRPKKKSRRKR